MKKSISLLLIMCMILAGCGKSSTDASSDEIVLADNQSLKYGQVTKISGNELTIALANEVSTSDMQSQRGNKNGASSSDPVATGDANAQAQQGSQSSSYGTTSKSGTGSSSGTEGSGQQQGNPPSGDMGQSGGGPGGDTSGGGTPPDMSNGAGQGGTPGSDSSSDSGTASSTDKQNKSDKSTSSNKGSSSGDSKQSRVMYQLTGEEETLTIPVGTAVTTSLGTTTTFSRIAVDDTLKLLMQKNDAGEEVIVGVWIVA